jgi:hypothetical protein
VASSLDGKTHPGHPLPSFPHPSAPARSSSPAQFGLVKHPPPIHKGQPLSVGLFHCGSLRVCGGFCGFLWTPRLGSVDRSRPHSTLSCPLFSRTVSRQKFEVRRHRNFARYRSMAYSRTFQAVGWRHCLAEGNHQPFKCIRTFLAHVFFYVIDFDALRNQFVYSTKDSAPRMLSLGVASVFTRPVHSTSEGVTPKCR